MFKNYLDWAISSEASNKYPFKRAKSFSFGQFQSPKEALKQAVLFRIQKMKENGYLLDERSTTIEHELANNINSDIEQLLNINLKANH